MTQSEIQLVAVLTIIAAAIFYLAVRVARKRGGDCPDRLTDDDCDDCPLADSTCKRKITQ